MTSKGEFRDGIAGSQCIRCSLLLHMLHVAWSVCLCFSHTDVLCKKTAEPNEMPFEG